MKGNVSSHPALKVLSIGLVTLILLHVIVSLVLVLYGDKSMLGRSRIAKAYVFFTHIGPFFREDAITSTAVLHLRSCCDGGSNYKDFLVEKVKEYRQRPWDPEPLLIRDFARNKASRYYSSVHEEKEIALRQLKHLVLDGHPDSTRLVVTYIQQWHSPREKTDTLFNILVSRDSVAY
jgi:hypothetical protein